MRKNTERKEKRERRRMMNWKRVIREKKCFCCGRFRHIVYNYRNRRNIKENRRVEVGRPEYQLLSNEFEVLLNRVI